MTRFCARCGEPGPSTRAECSACGYVISLKRHDDLALCCPLCREENDTGVDRCWSCGHYFDVRDRISATLYTARAAGL